MGMIIVNKNNLDGAPNPSSTCDSGNGSVVPLGDERGRRERNESAKAHSHSKGRDGEERSTHSISS